MVALRNLTDHTLISYTTYISAFLDYAFDILKKDPSDASWDDLRAFVLFLKSERKLSDRTINAVISQLRFFTLYILHKPWDPTQLPIRKFDQYIPFVPTRDEMTQFINAVDDPKAKAMIILMYSAGLRIGEVCNLKCPDIDRKNMRIHIVHSKNRSDRYALLSPSVLDILVKYWRKCGRPHNYLFPQRHDPDHPNDHQFLDRHIRSTEKKLGWPHRFSCHTFRHAFATHFYEDTHDLLTLKHLLGHKALTSTTIYVTLSNSSLRKYDSPFESLEVSYE